MKRGIGWRPVALAWLLRVIVGGVFVMSGFVKGVDLWGFVFKLEEYLSVWGWSMPRTLVMMGALIISAFEFVAGALLLLGCYKRTASIGLLLMMGVMLPLTLYIWVEDPVADCGCFGEFWVLSNAATFWKNVALTIALVWLAVKNGKVRQSAFNPQVQWIVGGWLTLYIVIISLYGYNFQPMIDFRPYPVGSKVVIGEDEEEEPDIDVPELALFDGDEDVTDTVLKGNGREILVVMPEPGRAGVEYSYTVNEMKEYADSLGVPMVGLLGCGTTGIERWIDLSMAEYPCYTADDSQLKELTRGTLSVVLLNDGVIEGKRSVASLNPVVMEHPVSYIEFFDEMVDRGSQYLRHLTLAMFAGLLLLYFFQGAILAVKHKIWQRIGKRGVS